MNDMLDAPATGPTMDVNRLAVELNVAVATIYRWYKAGGILPPTATDTPVSWLTKDILAWKKTRVPGRWKHALKHTPRVLDAMKAAAK